jgi:polysaccharide export outer membrane protein
MKRLILFFLVCLAAPCALLAQDYVISEGDGLAISVWDEPTLSISAAVRPDGKITLPGIGDVQAAGYTPAQLTGVLTEKITKLVRDPIVTVTVEFFAPFRVFIFGGGVQTGMIDLPPHLSLLQALISLGEHHRADFSRAYVLRDGEKIKENLYALVVEGDESKDLPLRNNDVLFIPPLSDPNVYVLGAVNAPMFIPYRAGLTVLEAILQAGGFNPFAKENSTTIVRRQGAEKITIPVRAKDLIRGDTTQNLELLPGDYIIVREGFF